jgi:hypothetical protein
MMRWSGQTRILQVVGLLIMFFWGWVFGLAKDQEGVFFYSNRCAHSAGPDQVDRVVGFEWLFGIDLESSEVVGPSSQRRREDVHVGLVLFDGFGWEPSACKCK